MEGSGEASEGGSPEIKIVYRFSVISVESLNALGV
jgi:hypothetical protein